MPVQPLDELTMVLHEDPVARKHPAWPAFDLAMRRNTPRTSSAAETWQLFRDGWDAKSSQLWHTSTDEWCDTW